MQITKTSVLKEVTEGGSVTEIAKRLAIPVAKLREAAKAFNINLRNKPKKQYSFIDDTAQTVTNSNPETVIQDSLHIVNKDSDL